MTTPTILYQLTNPIINPVNHPNVDLIRHAVEEANKAFEGDHKNHDLIVQVVKEVNK